ncbi:GNAT family N-acetyltransferase [Streptomyces sp. NPDC089919]|uniref:GNAT family N-acetyltransferase n=1 Tax=Streptomyces sp. NPDC089919 TaxID=3155188 RepID=UPI00344266D7
MTDLEIASASAADLKLMRDWADREGWNPGESDRFAFAVADPRGFLVGRVKGDPVACISAVRYGSGFGFVGFYIARPESRGQGYGIQLWRAGMAALEGRLVGLDGVVEQQANYRKSGFRPAWTNTRFEGVPAPGSLPGSPPAGVSLVDAASLPFASIAAYDRRFFPEPREAFLAAWTGLPGRTGYAAVRGDEIVGFGVVRQAAGPHRIGPLYAADPEVAGVLLHRLAAAAGGGPVAVDVPEANPAAVALCTAAGLTPAFETARMYTGPTPDLDLPALYGLTSLELG